MVDLVAWGLAYDSAATQYSEVITQFQQLI
jgi:hypothetical protein